MKGENYMAADKKEAASKQEALENALKKIEKDFGKGSIMRLGDAKAHMDIEVIPTGILPLDIALGVGGIPRGRIIEVYGPESSGKTTVALHMIAEAQENGASPPSSMPSMRLARSTPRSSASTSMTC